MNIDFVRETLQTAGSTTARKVRPDRPVEPAPAASAAPQPKAEAAEVDAAIEAANHSMRSVATNLQFEKDTSTGKTVVRVVDSETKQVLRQMPSEDMLAISKALDRLQGLMVHLKV
jgi:flagellar protein FlaG